MIDNMLPPSDRPHVGKDEFSSSRPSSATNNAINLAGLVAAFSAFCICRTFGNRGISATFIIVAGYAAVILSLEVIFLRSPWRSSVGLDFSCPHFSILRIRDKLIGLYGSLAFVGIFYWLLPEYQGRSYTIYWQAIRMVMPWVVILALPYIVFMDMYMKEPRDSYYWLGRCLLSEWPRRKARILIQHLLGWIVKGFFLPIMFVAIVGNINSLIQLDIQHALASFASFFRFGVLVCFTIDLLAAVAGYVLSIRLFDTHIRSTEPTAFGWWICTICYPPFQNLYMRNYLAFAGGDEAWLNKLPSFAHLQIFWGSLALAILSIYSLASISFGCRFSNLTHRGILTSGVYRLTKHPAYVSKNLFWWMTTVPFISTRGWTEGLRFSILLLGVNLVYYLRARTEERHLSRDPVYVAYALWMNEYGIFRGLGEYCPLLRYSPPKTTDAQLR